MTAPSIKEALKLLPCPFCGGEPAFNKVTYSERMVKEQEWDQDTFHGVNCVRCGVSNIGIVGHKDQERAAAFWNTRATFQPDGERREAIARIIDPNAWSYHDRLAAFHGKEYARKCAVSIILSLNKADEILASGLVQDEAGIRADEREKCAEIADLRYEPVATEIAAAIRSGRDGGAES